MNIKKMVLKDTATTFPGLEPGCVDSQIKNERGTPMIGTHGILPTWNDSSIEQSYLQNTCSANVKNFLFCNSFKFLEGKVDDLRRQRKLLETNKLRK